MSLSRESDNTLTPFQHAYPFLVVVCFTVDFLLFFKIEQHPHMHCIVKHTSSNSNVFCTYKYLFDNFAGSCVCDIECAHLFINSICVFLFNFQAEQEEARKLKEKQQKEEKVRYVTEC